MPASPRHRVVDVEPLTDDARALAAVIPEAVAILDVEGRVLEVNERLIELTGRARDELVGGVTPQPWWSLRGWRSGDVTEGDTEVVLTGRSGRNVAACCRLRALPDQGAGVRWVAMIVTQPVAAVPSAHASDRLVVEQDALLRVAGQVARGATPDEVFGIVAREVARVVGVEAGIVWRFSGTSSVVVGTYGEHGSQLGVAFPTTGDGAVAVVARTGRTARANYGALPGSDPTAARVVHQGYTSGVAAPVSVGGRPWGAVLAATTADRVIPADADARLERFAELAALAIGGAQSREELAVRATVDGLTDAINQGEFHRRLASECARAKRHGRPLGLVVLDLDHFKRINDGCGHQVGDRVLRSAATAIRTGLRAEDVLARVGGEEFALILPDTDAGTGMEVAERARLAVARMTDADLPAVTLSAGVADVSEAAEPDALFAAADGALYLAKQSGRNRVCRFDPAAVAPVADEQPRPANPEALIGVRALALAVEARDPETRLHSDRVSALAGRMAAAAGWSASDIEAIRQTALIHDIGKIGVPDDLLLKRGPLTPTEFERVKVHPALGASIVAEVLGPRQTAWVRHHHERFDGAGYPEGLAGTLIPEGARLLAVADAFDVMTSGRSYSEARDARVALAEVRTLTGTQFCPAAVAALESVLGS